MKHVRWALWIILFYSLAACKAELSSDEDGKPSADVTTFAAHCAKTLHVRKEGKIKGSEDVDLQLNFTVYGFQDGHFETSCTLSDGHRQYRGENRLSGGKSLYRQPSCDIIFDINEDSFGNFSLSYQDTWSWISYMDETGYSFDIKFASFECVEL